jgi:hypothetical protein
MKRREGVFRQQLKNGTYEDFMHHKEIYYINIYIQKLDVCFLQKTEAMHKHYTFKYTKI